MNNFKNGLSHTTISHAKCSLLKPRFIGNISAIYFVQTVGGIDDTLYTGTMWRSPLIRERFYEIVIADMEVDNKSLAMDCKEVSSNFSCIS